MTEPQRSERLGVRLHLRPGDEAALRAAARQVRDLALRHVCIRTDAISDDEGKDWLDRVGEAFGKSVSLLFEADRGSSEDAIARLIGCATHGIAAVALRDDCRRSVNATAALLTRSAARARGKHLVLVMSARDPLPRACELARHEAVRSLHAVAFELLLPVADEGGQDLFHRVAAELTGGGHAPETWIFGAPGPARPYDVGGQARAFVDLVATEADRVYWPALSDSPGTSSAKWGVYDETSQPKLLGRLLARGVGEVERLAALSGRPAAAAIASRRPVLVTGGAGFIGANLADRLAEDGHDVLIYDALARDGVERNLRWLLRRHPKRVSFALGDVRDDHALGEAAATASAVFHFAGQVAVTTSMVQPLADFDVNARGTLALLDALRRRNASCPLIFASTNKVYGDLADVELVLDGGRYLPAQPELRARGVAEDRPLCFHTPYGCSKGAADQYVLDYAHSFGLRTAVLRMSCIYGERQLGTEDQGWVAHFLLRAIAGEPVTIYGDGRQVRDVMHVGDAVQAYVAAWRDVSKIAGRAYNLGGGPANAISLLQLVSEIQVLLGKRVEIAFASWRPGDQRYFVADTGAVRRDLDLPSALGWRAGLARLAEHFGACTSQAAPMTEPAL